MTAALRISNTARALAQLREADRLMTSALTVLSRADVEADTGMPAEFNVRFEARRTSWEARETLGVADALRAMPGTRAALERADISWSQCRAIVRAARDVRTEQRREVDELIALRAPQLLRADPDAIVREVDDLCARLRADRELKAEERRIETSFLVLRPKLTGGGSMYAETDEQTFTTMAEALDAFADRPRADDADPDEPHTRARQHMEALGRICEMALAGEGGASRPRPRLLATFDVNKMTTEGGKLLWPLPGPAPRLTPLATEVLACDAEIVPIAFDGPAPIAVGSKQHTVPPKIRTAIMARDRGCRFPGCSAPAQWSDAHHIRWRSEGGTDEPSNLITLCRRCHRRVHRQRWSITLQADGAAEFQSRRHRWVSPRRE